MGITFNKKYDLFPVSIHSDSPPHVPPDELSTDMVIQVIGNMTHTIREHFPNLTVYPALGNHDYWPQVAAPIVIACIAKNNSTSLFDADLFPFSGLFRLFRS